MNRQLMNRQPMNRQLVNRQQLNRPAVNRQPAQEANDEQATGESICPRPRVTSDQANWTVYTWLVCKLTPEVETNGCGRISFRQNQ